MRCSLLIITLSAFIGVAIVYVGPPTTSDELKTTPLKADYDSRENGLFSTIPAVTGKPWGCRLWSSETAKDQP